MTAFALTALALAAATHAPATPRKAAASSVTIRERIILRVPARHVAPPIRPAWRETRGPRCMTLSGIDGAAVVDASTVDFILDGGTRLRARFERGCPALDFYAGFYLAPTADGQICAGRDELHDRSGSACGIDRFRLLVVDPAPAPPIGAAKVRPARKPHRAD